MLKKLRMKFVLTNMLFAATMLCIIFGLIYHFTRANLARESVDMMQSIAQEPLQQGFLGAQTEEIRLPYFTLQIGMHGELIATSGGDFDLSDEEFLMELLELSLSDEEDTGVLEETGLEVSMLMSVLGELDFKGLARSLPGAKWRRLA